MTVAKLTSWRPHSPSAAGSGGHGGRADRLALAVPPIVAVLATLSWFPVGRFLAAGDVTPFLRDGVAPELTALWNHRMNGAGGTTSTIARAPEVIVIRVVGIFGGSESIAQLLFYAGLMAFAAFGTAYLARSFVENPFAVAAAGLLGIFNPFVLVRLPNPLPVLWIGLVATAAATLIRAARGAPCRPVAFAALLIGASYLSINPPLLATAAVTLVAVVAGCSWMVGPGGSRRAARFLLRSAPWAIALNLWWLVPVFVSTAAREGVRVAAQTRVEDWSWSHGMNTVPNVITLTADWGWRYPEYLSFARGLDAAPWTALRWILPVLALTAPFVASGRRRTATFVLLGTGVVSVFFAKGLHPPLTSWNLWLYHHIPGMWLLREPISKVGGVLLLVEVVLAAIALTGLLGRLPHLARRAQTVIAASLGAAVILALAFPYPLWVGGTGSDGRHGLPSDEVSVPRGWHQLADVVNDSPIRGKALVLPLDPYYQVTTTWGFHGADDLVPNLVRRPVLHLLPDGYFSPSGDLPEMLRATEDALATGQVDRARTLLHALGVSHVIVRHDLADTQVVRPTSPPEAIASGLAHLGELVRRRRFGVADLYTVEESGELVWSPKRIVALTRRDTERRVGALADLGPKTAVVAPGSVPVDALSWEAADTLSSQVRFSLRRAGRYDIGLVDPNPSRWRARVITDPGARVQLEDPVGIELDGQRLSGAPDLTIPVFARTVTAVEAAGRFALVRAGQAMVDLDGATVVRALAPSAPPAQGPPALVARTCGPREPGQPRPSARAIRGGVEITSTIGVACTTLPGPALSPENVYRLRLRVRNDAGSTDRLVCLWQAGPDRCAPLTQPSLTRRWSTYDTVVRTEPGVTGLTLYLYAAGTATMPARVRYRDISLTPLRTVGASEVTPDARPPATQWLERGEHILRVTHPPNAVSLRPNSTLGDCHNFDDRTARQAGLAVHRLANGVELTASTHAACVHARIPEATSGGTYTLELDVRTVSGPRARLCIWQDGPDRCARLAEPPPGSDSWSEYRTRFTLDPGTTAARLYLYADGDGAATTVTQYRNLQLRTLDPEVAEIRPHARAQAPPAISWGETGPSSFSARVRRSRVPQLIVLNEAYGSGWRIDGAPTRAHVRANGYANAWLVRPNGGALELRYGPSRLASLALIASAVTAALAVGITIARSIYRRRAASFPDITGSDSPAGSAGPEIGEVR